MSLVLENSSDLIDLGDAIRSKTGGSSNLTVAQMATAVNGLTIATNKTWNLYNNIAHTPDYPYYSNQHVEFDLSSYSGTDTDNWILQIPIYTTYTSNGSHTYLLVSPLFKKLWVPNYSGQYWYLQICDSVSYANGIAPILKSGGSSSKIYGWISADTYSFTTRKIVLTATQSGTNPISATNDKATLLVLA